jgi:hypothetical protein
MASKAARSKPNRDLVEVKTQLQELTREVLAGELETGRAAVANQLLNTRLRAMELERKLRESDGLAARLDALERILEDGASGARERSWGT